MPGACHPPVRPGPCPPPHLSPGVLDCLSQRLLPALERPVPPRGIPATSGPAWSQCPEHPSHRQPFRVPVLDLPACGHGTRAPWQRTRHLAPSGAPIKACWTEALPGQANQREASPSLSGSKQRLCSEPWASLAAEQLAALPGRHVIPSPSPTPGAPFCQPGGGQGRTPRAAHAGPGGVTALWHRWGAAPAPRS